MVTDREDASLGDEGYKGTFPPIGETGRLAWEEEPGDI